MARFAEDVEIIGGSLIVKQPTDLAPVSGLTPIGEKVRIRIRAEDDSIAIFDGEGKQAFRFNSRFAVLDVGGEAKEDDVGRIACEGDIRVYDGQGRIRVHIDGQSGGIRVHDNLGIERIQISGQEGAIKISSTTLAVEFEVIDSPGLGPGSVMVMGEDSKLRQCDGLRQRSVVGVLAGGPGIVLDSRTSSSNRWPLAVAGKIVCKVDPAFGGSPIVAGSLLTTSPTPGHAMKVDIGFENLAIGAIIGKALRAPTADNLIPILVSLQ